MSENISLKKVVNSKRKHEESNLQTRILQVQGQINELEGWKNTLTKLLPLTDTNRTDKIDFGTIEKVVYVKKYENFKTDEIFYHFDLKADSDTFAVLMEYLGEDAFIEQSVYHLHTPIMSEFNVELTKEAILHHLNSIFPMILTHRNTTFEEEISKFVLTLPCTNDFVYFSEEEYDVVFQEGKEYKIVVLEKNAKVEYKQGKYYQFKLKELKDYFDIDLSKFSTTEEETISPEDILGEFDSFLRGESEGSAN